VATLSKHASSRARTTTVRDGEQTAQTTTTPPTNRAGRRRAQVPRSRVGYAAGITTVCALALVNMLAGQPATATVEPTGSVAVAEALGIEGTPAQTATPADAEVLGQLAASRAERDADQAEAALSQSRAERAAIQAKAEAEKAAAEAAAAAAAAEAEAAAAAESESETETEAAEAPVAEAPAAAPAGTAVSVIAQISNSAGPIHPAAQAAANAVVSNVPGAGGITLGGTRPSAADPGGHPSGLAVDYMVLSDAALGDAIVAYHIANWDALGVEYIIWQQRYLDSPGGSWSSMENRGSATANHMDHPHVNYRG
jgi:hypothetical protein